MNSFRREIPLLRLDSPLDAAIEERATRPLPDVDVLIISFNHRAYVAQAMESVFGQRYPGNVRLIVSDDCSDDGTQEEARRLATGARMETELVLREHNLGGPENLKRAWATAQSREGSYLALLEGDDYWSDPGKLAHQVAALDLHPHATLAFSDAERLDEASGRMQGIGSRPPADADLLLMNLDIPTCTTVFRKGVVPAFPQWFSSFRSMGWPLFILHGMQGDVIYMGGATATYRVHSRGKWSQLSPADQIAAAVRGRELIWSHFGYPDPSKVRKVRSMDHIAFARHVEGRTRAIEELFAAALTHPAAVVDEAFWRALVLSMAGTRATKMLRTAKRALGAN